ncbi:hypothetical protein GR925_25865 [Streptomyces sp. HUCO-GS316]|uniref:hypothetical protein n=1 Tax=Streptomyces sp. HUCO-GS316 TaxID=2692198 RepID=UPI0014015056|nr:hypothetical protein [Streptomyces sp. HUCO-GS316]
MTDHDTLLSLLGEWVTVTHPGDDRRVWHGQLASMMDSPSIVLRMPGGGTEVLPQSFTVQAAAPATGGPHPDPDSAARSFAELIDSGLLWLINRTALHPRGLALALHLDEHGQAYGWSLIHTAGGEPWQYDPTTDHDGHARAEATIAAELADLPAPPATPTCATCGGGPVAFETDDGRKFCAGCVSCKCGQPTCHLTAPPADTRPDTASGRPDTSVRTSAAADTAPALTSADAIRTRHPDTASARPDPMPRAGLRAAVAELADLPPDLLGDTRCSCGQDSPLILVTPDGGHLHLDAADHERLQRGQEPTHPAVAAWGQCWDRAEAMRTRLELARQTLIADGYFTADEVGDDIAPRLAEWLIAHRARVTSLTDALDQVLRHFVVPELIEGQAHLRTGNVDVREITEWRRTVEQARAGDPLRRTGTCPRPDCADTREDAVTAAGAYEVLRTSLTAASDYVTRQKLTGFPLGGGDTRQRILGLLSIWTRDPGPLKLRTVPELP